jgi:hypothetical protein
MVGAVAMSKGERAHRRPAMAVALVAVFAAWLVAMPALGARPIPNEGVPWAGARTPFATDDLPPRSGAPASAAPVDATGEAVGPPAGEIAAAITAGETASAITAGETASAITAGQTASAIPSVARGHEVRISGSTYASVAGEGASEPIVATHPTDPHRLAVTYLRFGARSACGADPAVAISHDGGRTWDEVRRPWLGSGRCSGFHAAVVWGPGPREGSARLYWVGMATGGGLRPAVAWTDDEGRTWSKLQVVGGTPGWAGGMSDITVDRAASSPNRGAVYVVYNWRGNAALGPGIRLLASADFGRTWHSTEVGRAPAAAGYPVSWRIGARVRTGPDGSAYVAVFQADLRSWDPDRPFTKAGWGRIGRVGYAITRATFVRSTGRLKVGPTTLATALPLNAWTAWSAATPGTTDNLADPTWSLSLDVDQVTGRVLLAGGSYAVPATRKSAPATPGTASSATSPRPNGSIRVGRSDDGGRTWRWAAVPSLPAVGGRPQSSFRPQIVARDGLVVVCLRGITDVPVGTNAGSGLPTLGVALTWSTDGGATFAAPRALSPARWRAASLAGSINGPGLRDRAELTADEGVVYVYGDGRLARPAPDARAGRVTVCGTLIELARRASIPATRSR